MIARCGWDDDDFVRRWPGRPPLDGDRTADACVVGLGTSGLAAVAELVRRGLSVVGVDRGRIGGLAAGRNGGFLLGGGAPFLPDAIAAWGTEQAVGLYRATLAELDRLGAELGPAVIRRTGSIRLAGLPGSPRDEAEAADRAIESADCARHAAALREHGIAVEDYDGELGRGLFLPDDAATNPSARALRTAARTGPTATLYEHTGVTAVAPGAVVTEYGTVSAGVVIVAIDGRIEALLPQLAGRVRTARLQMLRTAPVPDPIGCPVYGRWGYDYAQSDADGRLYVGGGRDRFVDVEWTGADNPTPAVQAYVEDVATRMAGRAVVVENRWAAPVGYTPDGRAVVAAVDDAVVACGGYSGTGNLVGPIAARAAVALALDGTPPPGYFTSSGERGPGA